RDLIVIFYSISLIYIMKNKKIKIERRDIYTLFFLTTCWLGEFFITKEYSGSIERITRVIPILFFLPKMEFSGNQKKSLVNLVIFLTLIPVLDSFYGGDPWTFLGKFIFTALLLIFPSVGVVYGLYGKENIGKRLVYLVMGLLAFYMMFKTGSRSGMVAFLLVTAISLITLNLKKGLSIVAVLTLIFTLSFGKMPIEYQDKFKSIKNTKSDISNLGRLRMWRFSYFIIKENPIIGIGFENFYKETEKEKYNEIRKGDENFTVGYFHPHNEILNIWVSAGTLGILSFLILIWNIISEIIIKIKKNKDDKVLQIILLFFIYILVFGMFEPLLLNVGGYVIWFILSLGVGDYDKSEHNCSHV
ncbi:MAG: O-antigen ligase family protein, partial [Cetobacterium sp.]